jgi:hypothetical protein
MPMPNFENIISWWLLLTIPLSIVFGFIVIGLHEWLGHAILMHQPTWLSRNFKYFRDTLDEHVKYHHGHCYPGRKFDDGAEDECLLINIDLKPLTGVIASAYIWVPMLWFFPVCSIVFVLMVIAHHTVWGVVHRQMHTKRHERAAWFRNSPLCLAMARFHCLHHIYPRKNHSIIFIMWDHIFGTVQTPSEKDVQTMRDLGLYGDEEMAGPPKQTEQPATPAASPQAGGDPIPAR